MEKTENKEESKLMEEGVLIVIPINKNIIRISDGMGWAYHPMRRKNTKWKRRMDRLGLPYDCGCVFEEISRFFEAWVPRRVQSRDYVKDLLEVHFGFLKELTPSAIDIIREILIVMIDIGDIPGFKGHRGVRVFDFITRRYNISQDCTYTILSLMSRLGLITHGTSLRYPIVQKEGETFLYTHDYIENVDNDDLSRFLARVFDVKVDINRLRGYRGKRDIVPVLLADV